ncbi:MAG: ATP-binding protein [Bacteroidota bacterium]
MQRKLEAAKFPLTKSLESFDFSAQPAIPANRILSLADCTYIRQREGLIFMDNPGMGKTHLATALVLRSGKRSSSTSERPRTGHRKALLPSFGGSRLTHSRRIRFWNPSHGCT